MQENMNMPVSVKRSYLRSIEWVRSFSMIESELRESLDPFAKSSHRLRLFLKQANPKSDDLSVYIFDYST